jgi:pimeloyl-ACP methyl ester carboxylesterase
MKKMILMLLLLASYNVVLSSCSDDDNGIDVQPKTFVLVHGAWQAPYVWDSVKIMLEKKGSHVIVVELPGHGADLTAPQQLSLDVYRDKVIAALSKVNGKAILVGHSLGGVIISAVAEEVPSKIERLVYIGAFLPASGQSLLDLAQTDADSQLGRSLRPSADQLTLGLVNENITSIFIQDGSATAKSLVLKYYRPEPAIPFTNKVTLTAAKYGSVPKVYIKTLQDHAVSPSLQDRTIAAAGVKTVYQLNTSHSPFLSKPDSVAIILSAQ